MRHRGQRLFIASTRPEQPGHHFSVIWRRKMGHPVDATAYPLPIARMDVIRVLTRRKISPAVWRQSWIINGAGQGNRTLVKVPKFLI
jgi:hypothetical protein